MIKMTKCYHFNQGYCKEKENCTYVHIIEECPTNCKIITCELRHKKSVEMELYVFTIKIIFVNLVMMEKIMYLVKLTN